MEVWESREANGRRFFISTKREEGGGKGSSVFQESFLRESLCFRGGGRGGGRRRGQGEGGAITEEIGPKKNLAPLDEEEGGGGGAQHKGFF